ncbi:PID-CTERM protein-sorting domain-containing protein [Jejuia pallidilutea]
MCCTRWRFASTSQPPPPVGLPIDGGVLVGALVALFYGGKKLLKK